MNVTRPGLDFTFCSGFCKDKASTEIVPMATQVVQTLLKLKDIIGKENMK